jgi:hypothetical protein
MVISQSMGNPVLKQKIPLETTFFFDHRSRRQCDRIGWNFPNVNCICLNNLFICGITHLFNVMESPCWIFLSFPLCHGGTTSSKSWIHRAMAPAKYSLGLGLPRRHGTLEMISSAPDDVLLIRAPS